MGEMCSLPWLTLAAAVHHAVGGDVELRSQYATVTAYVQRAETFAAKRLADEKNHEGLYADQIAALHLCSPGSPFLAILNARLSDPTNPALAPFLPFLKLFLSALYKLPQAGVVLVHRAGTADDPIENVNVDDTFTWWAVVHAARDPAQLSSTAATHVHFAIRACAAIDVRAFSVPMPAPNPALPLYVLPLGGVYVVTAVETHSEGDAPAHAPRVVHLQQQGPWHPLDLGDETTSPAQERLLATLAAEMLKHRLYPFGKCTGMAVAGGGGLTFLEAARQLECSPDARQRAVGLWALARCTGDPSDTQTLADGRAMDRRALCVQALHCDTNLSLAYNSLAAFTNMDEHGDQWLVALCDGRMLDEKDLYIEALRCDPAYSVAYVNLGITVGSGTATLRDGRVLTRPQLYIEALHCEPNNGDAFNNLGACIPPGVTVTLKDGRVMDKRQLYLEALHCDPNCSLSYNNLGVTLRKGETVTLLGGRTLTKAQVYIEALRTNENNADAYNNLSIVLTKGETVTLSDGRELDKRQLLMEALHCNPNFSFAYNNLGAQLAAGETVTLRDGRVVDDKALYIEALRCNENNASAYHNLACTLSSTGMATLANGWTMGRRQLFVEALRSDPREPSRYTALARELNSRALVMLSDGRVMNQAELQAAAAALGAAPT